MRRLLSWSAFAVALAAGFPALGCAGTSTNPTSGDEDELVSGAPGARRELTFACPKGDAPIKVAFFDADSTLRVSKNDAVSAQSIDDVDILPFAAKTIRALDDEGFLVAVVSNQGGIAAGKTTYEIAEGALATTAKKLGKLGARVHYFDFAEADDELRKPEIGMAKKLEEVLEEKCGRAIDLSQSRMIGDSGYKKDVDGPHPDGRDADDFSNSDRLFAENLGVPFAEPTDAFGWKEYGVFNVLGESELIPFLDRISKRANQLREAGDDETADALDAEVAANRKVNGLTEPK